MTVVTCPSCGAKNRVDESRAAALRPKCGRCGTPLDASPAAARDSGKPITVTDDSLEAVLRSAGEKPVLVDCWAAWCGPCRAIAQTIDQLAADANRRYIVGKLDVDANQRTAARYKVEGIPALLIFKRGQLVEHLVGLQPKQVIEKALQSHL
jgi:thioredoxin